MSKKKLEKQGLINYFENLFLSLGYSDFINFLADRRIDADKEKELMLKQIYSIIEHYGDNPSIREMIKEEINNYLEEIPTWKS